MRVRPITPEGLTTELAEAIDAMRTRWVRVAIDGAEPAGTGELADSLVDPLRVRGRDVVRVRTVDYLRPRSLRLEHGRDDPDTYYSEWFDFGGLRREVLDPLSPGGNGYVLPALHDAETDRSPRRERVPLADGGVALVDGPLLLGAGLDFDRTVHLWLDESALRRLLPDEERWKLPAYQRYHHEVSPQRFADHVVRTDRPGRPAIVDALDA